MRRLLLLCMFFPVMLFGQARRKAIVDSIKAAATNLQNVSALVGKYPEASVERTRVSDSADYVTIVVRVHVPDAGVLPVLPIRTINKLAIAPVAVVAAREVRVPPPPPPVIEAYEVDPLSLHPISKLKTRETPPIKATSRLVPPLPDVRPLLINALPTPGNISLLKLKAKDVPVLKMTIKGIPPLPDVRPLLIDSLPLHNISVVRIDHIAATVNAAPLPPPPNIIWEDLDALQPYEMIQLAIAAITKWETDTVAVPSFEQKKLPVAEMHLSDEGYSLLEKMEGFSPELYTLKDGGFTIGFGFFVPYNEVRNWSKGVTMEKAELLIREKMPTYEDQVKQYVNVPLTQEEFDALTMMAYNLGGFSRATSIVNDINTNADFEQLKKDWMKFVHSKAPGVAKGLMNRRRDELQVRNESEYQHERKLQIFKNSK